MFLFIENAQVHIQNYSQRLDFKNFRNSENYGILKSHKDKLSYAIHVCKSIDIDEYAHVNLNEEDRTQNMELIDEQDFINIE